MKKPAAVWLPENIADGYAIQAWSRGEADGPAQLRAFRCIVEEIAGAYAMSFDPESDRQTCFAEGRRHVGRVIVGIAKLNLGVIPEAEQRIAARRTPTTRKGRPNG